MSHDYVHISLLKHMERERNDAIKERDAARDEAQTLKNRGDVLLGEVREYQSIRDEMIDDLNEKGAEIHKLKRQLAEARGNGGG